MEKSTPQRPTPVAFWRRNGDLWIEFSDGHSLAFGTIDAMGANRRHQDLSAETGMEHDERVPQQRR